jgi:cysteine synthase
VASTILSILSKSKLIEALGAEVDSTDAETSPSTVVGRVQEISSWKGGALCSLW